ncbi:hypothetical protein PMK1_c00044 (plasmid) [Klebsiella pneumoniae]|nr:hypothetical protein PMK1_c00044 [Klebsiella pneumoniae]
MRLASRFGLTHSIRQERPLTNDELVKVVPSVFSEEKHNSRSDRYTGNDSNLLIVFYVQIMPDDFVMQLHRF